MTAVDPMRKALRVLADAKKHLGTITNRTDYPRFVHSSVAERLIRLGYVVEFYGGHDRRRQIMLTEEGIEACRAYGIEVEE
jgi:hypothetical protein